MNMSLALKKYEEFKKSHPNISVRHYSNKTASMPKRELQQVFYMLDIKQNQHKKAVKTDETNHE
jgi:hypothetical protein